MSSEPIINRSQQHMDKETFSHLMDLCLQYNWLQTKPNALYELWMMADNKEQQEMIDYLLSNYKVIDENTLRVSAEQMARQVTDVWGLPQNNTVIVAVCDDTKPDGSQYVLQMLKNKFRHPWKEHQFFNSITHGAKSIPKDGNIVLIDDFIGTGDTIGRKVKYVKKVVANDKKGNVRIYILALAAMKFSEGLIKGFSTNCHCVHWLLKGITEATEEPVRSQYIAAMTDIEKRLQKTIKGKDLPNFGYKRSEALFCIGDLNVPNNVFPVFWWPNYKGGLPRETLFHRL